MDPWYQASLVFLTLAVLLIAAAWLPPLLASEKKAASAFSVRGRSWRRPRALEGAAALRRIPSLALGVDPGDALVGSL
jgi:hypothetical protein